MAATQDTTKVENNPEVSINCSTCAEVEKTTVAIKYCLECKSYMCEECIQQHNRFAALRRHQLVEVSNAAVKEEMIDQSKAVTGVECHLHYGQNIDSYCKDHDEVCCPMCLTIKHRACKQIQKIQTAVKGLKDCKEFTKQALEKVHEYANNEKRDRNIYLATLDEKKNEILADIDRFEEKLIKRIKDLANASRENLRVTHAKHENAVTSDFKELDTVMAGLMESLNKLNKTDSYEIATFVSIKNCQKALAGVKQAVDDLSDKWLQTELHYQFKDNIIAEEQTAFGNVIEETKKDKTYVLTCKSHVNISVQTDKKTCEVTEICQLSDETFVIIDRSNANLKRLTETYFVTGKFTLKTTPICMCVTGPQEVAVLGERNLIQFVKVDDKFTAGPSFYVQPENCLSINYDYNEGRLYVCFLLRKWNTTEDEYNILVYNRNGTLLKENKEGLKTWNSLKETNHILLGSKTTTVLESQKGFIVVYKTAEQNNPETKIVKFADQKFLCFLIGNKMLVKKRNKDIDNLSLLSIAGKCIKTLKLENTLQIQTAIYNKQKSTLLVAGASCEIREYKLPIKLLKLLE